MDFLYTNWKWNVIHIYVPSYIWIFMFNSIFLTWLLLHLETSEKKSSFWISLNTRVPSMLKIFVLFYFDFIMLFSQIFFILEWFLYSLVSLVFCTRSIISWIVRFWTCAVKHYVFYRSFSSTWLICFLFFTFRMEPHYGKTSYPRRRNCSCVSGTFYFCSLLPMYFRNTNRKRFHVCRDV